MRKNLILEDKFEFKQKAIFFVLMMFPFLVLISLFSKIQSLKHTQINIFSILTAVFICILISSFFLVIAFLKKGLSIENNNLYISYSFLKKNIYRSNVNLNNNNIFSIFNKNVIQNNTYLSAGKVDLSYKYLTYDFVLLNENHLKRSAIITVTSIESKDNLKVFLEENSNLKYEIYSPKI